MGKHISKLRREIENALRATGLPWRLENGKRHHQIIIDDKLIGVISHGCNDSRDGKNIIAKIRKFNVDNV